MAAPPLRAHPPNSFKVERLSGLTDIRHMTGDPFSLRPTPTCAECAGIGLPVPAMLWNMEDDTYGALSCWRMAGDRSTCPQSR